MNPVGYRYNEEKKTMLEPPPAKTPSTPTTATEVSNKSHPLSHHTSSTSYKSTHSSRSSVLERAREYNRRIEDQQQLRRSKSLERNQSDDAGSSTGSRSTRSHSTGRSISHHNHHTSSSSSPTTRERAMASVRKEHDRAHLRSSNKNPNVTSPTTSSTTNTTSQLSEQNRPPPPAKQQPPETTTTISKKPSVEHTTTRNNNNHAAAPPAADAPVVSPEMLVDALSGHEDGLLAIAEKLMESYDAGYDVMGEAIIDAFADVQKLFQHVVEAAHMEGAAFEASRREEEIAALRKQLEEYQLNNNNIVLDVNASPTNNNNNNSGGPTRHDEFIDPDVKEVLHNAIRQGTTLRGEHKHRECYQLFERACQDASSLLPVDSDHRGRLQLSIARAESMSPDRACAILRYAMDDVLRSGLRNHVPLPDPSKRADVVLTNTNTTSVIGGRSSEEALASLTAEMKEILTAPIYENTPLQHVAKRFWNALAEAQKTNAKHAEKLEQNLAKLKGEFLLARAEWEEKMNQATQEAETYKTKYSKLKESYNASSGSSHTNPTQSFSEGYLEQARSFASRVNESFADDHDMYGSVKSAASGRAGSVASGVNSLAQQAKTIVNSMNSSFNCANIANSDLQNEIVDEVEIRNMDIRYESASSTQRNSRGDDPVSRERSRSRSKNTTPSRSFRQYSKSPHRVDI